MSFQLLDIWIAFGCQLVLFIAGVMQAERSSRLWKPLTVNFMAALTVSLFVLALVVLRGKSEWVMVFPTTTVVMWSDWSLLFLGFFCGLCWSRLTGHRVRKILTLTALVAPAIWVSSAPLRAHTPKCDDTWSSGVCMQSSESSCSAAAAATLLRYYKISAKEQEMAELCLTHQGKRETDGGTQYLGLYRGLRWKTLGTRFRVDAKQATIDELLAEGSGPWIISVGLNPRASDPIYQERYGWPPGLRHSVVLFQQVSADRVEIGDPSVGREQWSLEDL